ncbi:hypothetical protein PP304_gp029 [Gordonia phage Phendrix]|uniref:Uncharacterized protein n=1 Tax=Gordonia phage Phendrix TaxID=2593335 RepID=A0A514U0W2_9CAUD|nr:hypothetical protein PP304_gp029 [Gordonia phage Phendrix]QDK02577.1 hypothetical protein SEA_PHENDRIX_29 [Gordonia phage Phendrix]
MIRGLKQTVRVMHRCSVLPQKQLGYNTYRNSYETKETFGVFCDCGWTASHMRNRLDAQIVADKHHEAVDQGYIVPPPPEVPF